ncbi:hypothetical protein WJX74_008413 [Apatococcus lobatus]|uniref:Tyrosine specific protein phosphatases domain-containing protein n=1 Tax=Apatococcus lobatus TaxID=904363 RepID=A0AAW1QUT1_9CHLO
MKEKRIRRNADHLPAGVEVEESFDDRGKKHISIVATQGAANLRDIASLRPEDLKLGRVFASSDDISNQQLSDIGVKTFLDLRVPQKFFTFAELKLLRSGSAKDPKKAPAKTSSAKAANLKPGPLQGFVTISSAAFRPCIPKHNLPPKCRFCATAIAQEKGHEVFVFHVELMQTSAKAAVFTQLPRSLKWKTLTSCCHHSSPKEVVEDNIGDGKAITYDHLYKILFDHSKKQFAQALRVFSRDDMYPILIHCQYGLDRTGMVVLLLMMLCHLPVQAVVTQYVESETIYQEEGAEGTGISKEEKQMFAESVLKTIEYFLNKWGTAEQYVLAIGLNSKDILAIKRNIMADGQPINMQVPDLINHQLASNQTNLIDRTT